jgi:hypothetical protein
MSAKDGGPAFPVLDMMQNTATGETTVFQALQSGMSLRDYMAIHAAAQDIETQGYVIQAEKMAACEAVTLPVDWRIRARYMHADAMLKAREAGK